jgi:hypothetical protein
MMQHRDATEERRVTRPRERPAAACTTRAPDLRARMLALLVSLVLPIVLMLLVSCSSDSPCPCGPSELVIGFSQAAVQITDVVIVTATSTGARGDPPAVDWYVDGHPGGSDSTGFITSTNPATFTAPGAPPAGGAVVIEARDSDDPSVRGEDTLAILFTIRYVDAASGDDVSGTGARTAPLRTVTAALQAAQGGDTVRVAPGLYDSDLGEVTPFDIPSGVALMGTHTDSCVLAGENAAAVVVLGDSGTVEGFTVRNTRWCDVGILSEAAGRIRDVRINDRFRDAAVRSNGASSGVVIENCEFVNTADPGTGRGLELVSGSMSTVRDCGVRGWRTGFWLDLDSAPLIELCEITENAFGIETAESSVHFTNPDLGGGERGSVGGNTIAGNEYVDLVTRTPTYIYAKFNTWDGPVPAECLEVLDGCDIAITNGGAVEWCECFRSAPVDHEEYARPAALAFEARSQH